MAKALEQLSTAAALIPFHLCGQGLQVLRAAQPPSPVPMLLPELVALAVSQEERSRGRRMHHKQNTAPQREGPAWKGLGNIILLLSSYNENK